MKLIMWEYKPDDGGEIDTYSIIDLGRLFEREGFSVAEAQKVVFAQPQEIIHIKKCGDFRRIS